MKNIRESLQEEVESTLVVCRQLLTRKIPKWWRKLLCCIHTWCPNTELECDSLQALVWTHFFPSTHTRNWAQLLWVLGAPVSERNTIWTGAQAQVLVHPVWTRPKIFYSILKGVLRAGNLKRTPCRKNSFARKSHFSLCSNIFVK